MCNVVMVHNVLLSGAPATTFDKVQRAQNNLARVVCQSRGRTDARPLLHSLHWLLVRQQVTCKLAVLTRKVQTTATSTYLSELVQTRAPPRALRSSYAPMLVVPRVHTELARRAFSVTAPSTWNSLPADIRLCENILTFNRHLKTHLFKLTLSSSAASSTSVCSDLKLLYKSVIIIIIIIIDDDDKYLIKLCVSEKSYVEKRLLKMSFDRC